MVFSSFFVLFQEQPNPTEEWVFTHQIYWLQQLTTGATTSSASAVVYRYTSFIEIWPPSLTWRCLNQGSPKWLHPILLLATRLVQRQHLVVERIMAHRQHQRRPAPHLAQLSNLRTKVLATFNIGVISRELKSAYPAYCRASRLQV